MAGPDPPEVRRAALSPAAYVVLGMLRKGARSGYDIKQAVDVSTRFFWTISHAQIYPALKALERDGLIRGEEAPHGQRQRRVYELTADGERVLAAWIADEEEPSLEIRDVGLLKLFFAGAAPGATPGLLRAMRERSEQTLHRMRTEILPAAEQLAEETGDRHPLTVLRAGIAVHESVTAIAEQLERELRDEAS